MRLCLAPVSDVGSDYSDTDVAPPAKRIRRRSSTPEPAASRRAERVTEAPLLQPQDHDDDHDTTNRLDISEWENVCSDIKFCKCCV